MKKNREKIQTSKKKLIKSKKKNLNKLKRVSLSVTTLSTLGPPGETEDVAFSSEDDIWPLSNRTN